MRSDATQSSDQHRPPVSWGLKAIILAGGPSVAMAITGVSVALPKIEATLAHTPADKLLIKMMIGIVGAAMVIGAPLTGFLSDRIGLRRVVFANYLVFVIAGTAGMYLEDLHLLVLARFLLGVAAAGTVTASIIVINRQLASELRAHWMGAYIAVAFISSIVLHPLAGVLAELNWHYTFAIYLFGAPFALLALISIQDASQSSRPTAKDEEPLLSWFPYRFALLGLMIGCISYLPLIYAPFLLREMGIGPAKTSFILLGDTLTGTLMALYFGRARRRLSADAAFIIAFALAAVGGVVTGLANNYFTVMIGMAIIGFGTGWFMPNLMESLGTRVQPHQQGRAAGLVKAANYVSTPVCILSVERLYQIHGPRYPILISSVIAIGLLLLTIYQLRSSKRALKEPPGRVTQPVP